MILLVCVSFSVQAKDAGGSDGQSNKNRWVRLQLTRYETEMKLIQSHSLDVAGVDFRKKQVDLWISPAEIAWVRGQGFVEVPMEKTRKVEALDARYQNPIKIESALKQYAAQFPNLASIRSIGKSIEGRDIWAIRLTQNVGVEDGSKPHVFFNSMHHAREVMTSEIGLDLIDQLLTQYGKDPQVTHWMDSFVIDVIPMFNVDGNNLVWTHDSMWRKNAHGGYGVDINRNYPYAWNSCHGSSGSRDAQDFHGDSAASEPETKVMMDFVKSIRPVFSISYHSYSEIVIYPYGCSGQHTETRAVVEKIGHELASKLKTDDGKNTYTAGTAPELLYSVDGGDIDWLYAVGKVIPFVVEVNASAQGFLPSYSRWRDKTVVAQREGWKYLLNRMDQSSIHGQVKNEAGAPIQNAKIEVRMIGSGDLQTIQTNPQGYFTVILNPGAYGLGVVADGYQTSAMKVTVGAERAPVSVALKKLK